MDEIRTLSLSCTFMHAHLTKYIRDYVYYYRVTWSVVKKRKTKRRYKILFVK
jgi:hypothetical protein